MSRGISSLLQAVGRGLSVENILSVAIGAAIGVMGVRQEIARTWCLGAQFAASLGVPPGRPIVQYA